jgi:hypothetical protein
MFEDSLFPRRGIGIFAFHPERQKISCKSCLIKINMHLCAIIYAVQYNS